jgi:hypothetical protein
MFHPMKGGVHAQAAYAAAVVHHGVVAGETTCQIMMGREQAVVLHYLRIVTLQGHLCRTVRQVRFKADVPHACASLLRLVATWRTSTWIRTKN